MKVLFGMIAAGRRDRSSFAVGRSSATVQRTRWRRGIAMIHQHFMLVDAMTVVENVMLGWPRGGPHPARSDDGRGACARRAGAIGLDLDPDALVARSAARTPAARRNPQGDAARRANCSILDEPTSNLAPSEVADLLTILRRLRAEGKGIVFITHKLPEVLEVCDEVVVLRAGAWPGARGGDVSRAELAEMMVGSRHHDARTRHVRARRAPCGWRSQGLAAPGLAPLTFEVRAGEILGVAGVDGNGQIELAETLAGLRPRDARARSRSTAATSRAPPSPDASRGARLYARGSRPNRAGAEHVGRREPDAARQPPAALRARRLSDAAGLGSQKAQRLMARLRHPRAFGAKPWSRGSPAATSRRSWSRGSSTARRRC